MRRINTLWIMFSIALSLSSCTVDFTTTSLYEGAVVYDKSSYDSSDYLTIKVDDKFTVIRVFKLEGDLYQVGDTIN